jgi:hypothetical protein
MKQKTTVATATKKTANNVVKSKNVVKQSTKQVKKSEKIIFLAEGITGKKLVENKIATNNEVKKENRSFSQCLKMALKKDQNFFTSFVNFNPNDLTPKNLCEFLKGNEGKNGYSSWLIMTLTRRYYAQK